jgi:hypothetical protein
MDIMAEGRLGQNTGLQTLSRSMELDLVGYLCD